MSRCVCDTQGPNPNKLPGKLGERFPSFQPTHATDALQRVQTALKLNSAALQAGQHDQQLLLREEALIRALSERYASGAAALKAKKWRQHETAYADRLAELAQREQVRGALLCAARVSPAHGKDLRWVWVCTAAVRQALLLCCHRVLLLHLLLHLLLQDDADIYALAAEAHMNLSPW